jgi:hypothetical protein
MVMEEVKKPLVVRLASLLREKADILRCRRMAFSSVDLLVLSREAHPSTSTDAAAQKSRKLRAHIASGIRFTS